ncbi:hypothetical protein MKW98_022320 [Papaver atlanticum]|uniref:Replication factor A C-terminal domain-containing protein n=1 Tax=Papaver atlanticum TaxID=357466 RepID=A0AAD4T6B0_9MAGN|nr:hypothetical protein MKW98_022320 [Papaver atlanticum]
MFYLSSQAEILRIYIQDYMEESNTLLEQGLNNEDCYMRCSEKILGENGNLWCTKCEGKVDMPIARFNLRFEVEDHAGATVFVALDSQVQKLVRQKAVELIGATKLI